MINQINKGDSVKHKTLSFRETRGVKPPVGVSQPSPPPHLGYHCRCCPRRRRRLVIDAAEPLEGCRQVGHRKGAGRGRHLRRAVDCLPKCARVHVPELARRAEGRLMAGAEVQGCRLTFETSGLKVMYYQGVEAGAFQRGVKPTSTCTALPRCAAADTATL